MTIKRDGLTSAALVEVRHIPAEVRIDESADPVIEGYAAVFNQEAVIGSWFREAIKPGAFSRAIEEDQDVRALLNHDANIVLSRTKNGTLELKEDETGLLVRIKPDMNVQADRDVVAKIKRGDIDQMSFAFTVPNKDGEEWDESELKEGKLPLRNVLDVDLYDVSPVTYPAYPQTSVGVRSAEQVFDEFRASREQAGEQVPPEVSEEEETPGLEPGNEDCSEDLPATDAEPLKVRKRKFERRHRHNLKRTKKDKS